MSKNNEKNKNKSKNNSKEKNNLDMIMNNNEETYQSIKIQKIKGENNEKKKSLINYEEIKNKDETIPLPKRRKRSNSVDLYKKQQREKEKKNKKESNKNIKTINNNHNNINNNINEVCESTNLYINRKSSKNIKNGKIKKVNFHKNFATIIDVESYKKFNEENTYKDPFEDMEFIKNLKNINLNNNNNKEDEDEDDGKAHANCSCLIC